MHPVMHASESLLPGAQPDGSASTSLQHSDEQLDGGGPSLQHQASGSTALGGPNLLAVRVYPHAAATHQQVVEDSKLFYSTLISLLNQLGLVLKVPKIAGQEIDLHMLYIEVTKLGGLETVINRKLFVAVCEPFNFPASFTNKSFVVRKLYCNVLHHYEQIYFFGQGGCQVVPVPVSEHQQAARSARGVTSPSKRGLVRSKSVSSRHPGTPRTPGATGSATAGPGVPATPHDTKLSSNACARLACNNSPLASPNGKRKQADGGCLPVPPAPTLLHLPPGLGMGGGPGMALGPSMQAPSKLGGGLSLPALPLGFKPLLHATASPSGAVGGGGRQALKAALAGAAAASGPDGMTLDVPPMLDDSPSTSCTSGTPQMAPPVLAPAGLEVGLEFPCRIVATYDNYYIITMHVPGIPPMLGQLMKGLPPGMSLAPNILPHQLIYAPGCVQPAAKAGARVTTAGTAGPGGSGGGSGSGDGAFPAMGMPPLPPTLLKHMGPGGELGIAPSSLFGRPSRAGGELLGGLSASGDNTRGHFARHGDDHTMYAAAMFPDGLLTYEQLTMDCEAAGLARLRPGMSGNGHLPEADAMAAITAQYSPRGQQDPSKKVRLLSGGGGGSAGMVGGNGGWVLSTAAGGGGMFSPGSIMIPAGGAHDARGTSGSEPSGVQPMPGQFIPLDAIAPPRDPPAPPRSAFTCFLMALGGSTSSEQLQGKPLQEVAAEAWESMSSPEKAPYQAMARRDYERYMFELAAQQQHRRAAAAAAAAAAATSGAGGPHACPEHDSRPVMLAVSAAGAGRLDGPDYSQGAHVHGKASVVNLAWTAGPAGAQQHEPLLTARPSSLHSAGSMCMTVLDSTGIPVAHGDMNAATARYRPPRSGPLCSSTPRDTHGQLAPGMSPRGQPASGASPHASGMAGQAPGDAGSMLMPDLQQACVPLSGSGRSPGPKSGGPASNPGAVASPAPAGQLLMPSGISLPHSGTLAQFRQQQLVTSLGPMSGTSLQDLTAFMDGGLGHAGGAFYSASTMFGQAPTSAGLRISAELARSTGDDAHRRSPHGNIQVLECGKFGAPEQRGPGSGLPSTGDLSSKWLGSVQVERGIASGALRPRGCLRPPPLCSAEGDEGDEDPMLHHVTPRHAVDTELFCRMDISSGGADPTGTRAPGSSCGGPGGPGSTPAARISGYHFGGMAPAEAAEAFAAAMNAAAGAGGRGPRVTDQDDIGSAADLLLAHLGGEDEDGLMMQGMVCSLDGDTCSVAELLRGTTTGGGAGPDSLSCGGGRARTSGGGLGAGDLKALPPRTTTSTGSPRASLTHIAVAGHTGALGPASAGTGLASGQQAEVQSPRRPKAGVTSVGAASGPGAGPASPTVAVEQASPPPQHSAPQMMHVPVAVVTTPGPGQLV